MSQNIEPVESAPDPSMYFATVIQRLLSEPFGLGLALFLAALFGLPSQIPDMIDPYFTWETWDVALGYTLISVIMGYTVWFWIVAAIRTEALIPGGRYYTPVGTPEIGYVDRFGGWYRPFNYAANFAGLAAFLACMSRPIYLMLQPLMGDSGPSFVAIILAFYFLYFLAALVFDFSETSTGSDAKSKRLTPQAKFISLLLLAALICWWFELASSGAFTAIFLLLTALLGAFVLVSKCDRFDDGTYRLKFRRMAITKPERRFSKVWSFRTTALFFAAPHGISGTYDNWQKVLWAVAWMLQIISPPLFLLWFKAGELDLLMGPDQFPTPIISLLAITLAIGPMILFLSLLRDVCELFLILCFAAGPLRRKNIQKSRNDYRASLRQQVSDPASGDETRFDGKVEHLARSAFVHNGQRNEVLRVVARGGALILVAWFFFSDFTDDLRYWWNEDYLNVGNEDYDPSRLTYHIAAVQTENDGLVLAERAQLKQALLDWHKARSFESKQQSDVPVVIVAAAGGANRAAVWTLSVLDALNAALPDDRFRSHVFALSGVSGGSLGAVTYAFDTERRLGAKTDTAPEWPLETAAQRDLLAPAIGYFFNIDLLRRFDIGLIPTVLNLDDRNEAIERSFATAWQEDWGLTGIGDTGLIAAHGNSAGRMPHLVLNGVDSRSGQRVITATLFPVDDTSGRPLFAEAQDFFGTFGHDIRPATAVMNSARFPLISPSGRYHSKPQPCSAQICPQRTRHQIIDGGYYENSGVQTAYELAEAIDALVASPAWTADWVPKPLIIAISNSAEGVLPEMVEASQEKNGESLVARSKDAQLKAFVAKRGGDTVPYFDDVTPTCDRHDPLPDALFVDAFEYAIESAAIIRGVARTGAVHNHRSFHIAMERYCGEADEKQFFHFGLPRPVEPDQRAPMNWVLSKAAVRYMVTQAPNAVINVDRNEFKDLRVWFKPEK